MSDDLLTKLADSVRELFGRVGVLETQEINAIIYISEARARSVSGLGLYNNTGEGIFVEDNTGRVGVGTTGPSDTFHVLTTNSWKGITLEQRSSSDTAPYLKFLKSRAGGVITANDYIGGIEAYAINSTLTEVSFAGIAFQATDPTAGSEDADIIFTTRYNGMWGARVTIKSSGNVDIGMAGPGARLHIDQSSTTAAIPVLSLDQADVSEGFINFIGSDRGSDLFPGGYAASVRVELNGTVYRIPLLNDA